MTSQSGAVSLPCFFGMGNAHWSDVPPEDFETPEFSHEQPHFVSSQFASSFTSSLLLQEFLPPPPVIRQHPLPNYETVTDYYTGKGFPNWYLNKIRGPVDSSFSNDKWGDEYYFPRQSHYTYIEDFKPNPYAQLDEEAMGKGLELRAETIPLRTKEESWKSCEESMNKTGLNADEEESKPLMFQEMQKRIQARIKEFQAPPLPRDLEPDVQQEKIMHSKIAMQGMKPGTLAQPGVHPLRIATAPFIARKAGNEKRVRNSPKAAGIEDGKLRASTPPHQGEEDATGGSS